MKLKLEIIKETANLIEEDSVRKLGPTNSTSLTLGTGPIAGPVMHLDCFCHQTGHERVQSVKTSKI
jgi:hypothetical protein